MKFAFKRSLSPVAYCALHVKTGTRYEESGRGGLAHFTEHLLFKGTESRSAGAVNSCIEKLGGELNAYTTKEETVIHATTLKEDLRKAVNLLMDIAFRCTFPEREIEKERGVVLEEINTYKDSPSEQIYDDFEELMFEGTPLSMPVLGKAKYLRKADRDVVAGYYKKMFVPENMFFTIVADMDEKKAESMVLRALETYATTGYSLDSGREETICPAIPTPLPDNPAFERTVNRHGHQAHCVIGARAYPAYDDRRIPLSLLINILGGPVANSKLNLLLRERYGLVYSVDASYSMFSDAGAAVIYFGCEKSNVPRCRSLVGKTLAHLRETPLSPAALAAAKKQLLGQMAIASDNGEAQVLSMGKSLMTYGRVIDNRETAALIESVTAGQILDAAQEIFNPSAMSELLFI
ncbi:MAG TPA: insulinase family protein [Candidatus Coprenecus stercoravium]|uniref:Insulinase family protein n=1 Tax=Candidatus Coprenecus stercoravium TaxID=2840735 RepID=A0A9D2GSD4_9BACT|nr:insulinase family protein [Candidatus Coprenecus stercoravium]